MNELSWLIYLADVFGAANAVTGLLVLATMITAPSAYIYRDTSARDSWDQCAHGHLHYTVLYPNPPEGERPEARRPFQKAVAPLIVALVVVSLANLAVPSKETMYAIAASEMGERVLHTETANKALTALNAWLDKQIAGAAQ